MVKPPSLPWWRRLTIQLVVLVLVFTVLPQIVLRTYNLQLIRVETLHTIQRNNLAQAENVARQLTAAIDNQTGLLQLLADSPPLRAGDWESARYELERFQVRHQEIATLTIIDAVGKERAQVSIIDVEPPCVWDEAPCFRTAMKGEIYAGDLHFISGLGQRLLVAVPIFDRARQEVIGVLAAQLSLRPLLEQLNATQIGEKGYVYLVDGQGRIIAHPDISLVLAQVDGRSIPEVDDLLNGGLEQNERAPSEYDSLSGERVFGVHAPVEKLGWGVIAEQPVDEALALMRRQSSPRTFMLFSSLLLSVILAAALSYFLARPVRRLTHAAQQLASGKRPVHVDSSAKNEIGQLASVFNQMTHNIQAAEEALRESETKYRQLVELAQEGIWVIDKDANTTFVNPSMAKMLGYTPQEMMGKHLFSFMDERGAAIATRNLERREQGIVEQHDFEFLRKDGARIYTTIETAPITDEVGDYVGAIAGMIDITERVQAEDEIKKLSKVIETTSQLVVITDLEGKVFYVNAAYLEISGYTQEEVVGGSMFEFSSEDGVVKLEAEVMPALLSTGHWRGEMTVRKKDGVIFPAELICSLLTTEFGEPEYFVAVFFDISERKQVEVELRKYAQQLETLQRVTAVLTASLSLDKVLNLILEQLALVVPYDSATIFMHEDEHLRGVAAQGYVHPEKIINQTFPSDDNFFLELLERKEPMYLADAQAHAQFDTWGDSDHIRGWMTAPMLVGETVIGYLSIDSVKVGAFGPEEAALALPFANQAAQAIENARLHEQIKRHADELEGRVRERTAELNQLVQLMAGREVRMAELKQAIKKLRKQLQDAGMHPIADDPLISSQ